MSPRVRAYFYLIVTSLIWGVAAVVIKLTLKGISPLPFLTYRFAISAVIGIVFLVRHSRLLVNLVKQPNLFGMAIIYGMLITTLGLGFLFLGLTKTTVLDLSLIDLSGPLLVALFGVIFLREHYTKRRKIGTIIALVGAVLILFGPQLFEKRPDGVVIGNLFVFLYVLSDSASSVFLKKILRKNFSALFLINFSFIVGFLTITPITLSQYSPTDLLNILKTLPLQYHLGVWFMALISGSLAFYLRALGQKTIGIGEAGVFVYLISVFSAPLAIIILGDKITPNLILGALIIVIGILIAETRKKMYN
jgi:drug/metabolite transporter (DMT)-like permease